MKMCSKCGERKPLNEFYGDDRGHIGECLTCCPNAAYLFRIHNLPCFECGVPANHDEYHRETLGSYGLCNNCADKFSRDNEAARLDAIQRQSEKHREWVLLNPNLARARNQKSLHKRTTIMQGVRHDLTIDQWEWLCRQTDQRCIYCGGKQDKLDQEHVVPVSQGGEYTIANIRPSCKSCNSKKWARTPKQAGVKLIAEYEDKIQAGLKWQQGKLF